MPIDVYHQANAADPVLAESLVLDIARRHAGRCIKVTSIDETGGEARVYGVDEHLVVKTQRPHRRRARTSLEKEWFFLDQLQAYPEIMAPRVLGYGQDGSIEYLVMTRMPGVAARTLELEGEKRREVLLRLGRALRQLHSIPQESFRDNPLFPGYWSREQFVKAGQAGLGRAVQVIAETLDLWQLEVSPEHLASRVLETLPPSVDLVALHSNPGPEHIFVHPDTLEFMGVIDFGDSYISHPALDWRWPTFQDNLTLLEGYCQETPVTDEFMEAWRSTLVLSNMSTLATRPAARPQAMERLRGLVNSFGWI